MKQLIYLMLFLPLLAMGQEKTNLTDSNGHKQGLWKRNYPNGRLMYEGNFRNDKPVGEWRRFHENGFIRARLQHSETDTVVAVLYDEMGKRVAQGIYLGEKKEGLWRYFSADKQISEEHFREGLKSGVSRIFYPDGATLEESEWRGGVKNGRYRAFYASGTPFLECMYENDQRHGFCISYFPSGAMEVDAFYRQDLPDGTWKYYSEQGEPRYTLIYNQGVLANPEVLYELETRQLKELEQKGRANCRSGEISE
jgi:antitoxin component YwqK of YwqJK toxin-antitoxin module